MGTPTLTGPSGQPIDYQPRHAAATCLHETSLHGRCMDCGQTWAEQAAAKAYRPRHTWDARGYLVSARRWRLAAPVVNPSRRGW